MMETKERQVLQKIQGTRTVDGAGVHLVRVLDNRTVGPYDPFLMLDSFDSQNPDEYTAGFPMHPHRGIETISYVYTGKMVHKDSLGNEDSITDGEVQWMTAGSGILHEEQVPAVKNLLGVQLWLNLPASDKMTAPMYHSIKRTDIQEIPLPCGKLRLLAGSYHEHQGYQSRYLPLDYYDIHMNPHTTVTLDTDANRSVILFTLVGNICIGGETIPEKTAVTLSAGNTLTLDSEEGPAQILYMSSTAIHEPVAWGGPIVMNTQDELKKAFSELKNNTFLKEKTTYK
jgi:redox-sensitive bicupin YhaK (pirin superfamily)